jgi:hypothetical protein
METTFSVAAEKVDQVGSRDGLNLGGLGGDGGDLVLRTGKCGSQTEDVPGTGDLENEAFALTGSGDELNFAMAKHKDVVDRSGFGEEFSAGWHMCERAHSAELGKRVGVEVAEETQGAMAAVQAIEASGLDC